ncbi:MAG: 50S ribosomal protein L11 methyltransferase [Thermodesulfobacteriota bacterium]
MEESSPSGWSYPLAPGLVLRTRRPPPGAGAGVRVILVRSCEAFPPSHPTTRLCLDLLREALAPGPVPSLLDVGCGCGVLSLAASVLGVLRVVGVDIASEAARVTWENARENGLAGGIMVAQGSTECVKARFDLVAANLPWEVQMDKAPELHRLAGAKGRLLLSGFRDSQEQSLRELYQKLGRSLKRRVDKDFAHPELPPGISFNWVAWLLA